MRADCKFLTKLLTTKLYSEKKEFFPRKLLSILYNIPTVFLSWQNSKMALHLKWHSGNERERKKAEMKGNKSSFITIRQPL